MNYAQFGANVALELVLTGELRLHAALKVIALAAHANGDAAHEGSPAWNLGVRGMAQALHLTIDEVEAELDR